MQQTLKMDPPDGPSDATVGLAGTAGPAARTTRATTDTRVMEKSESVWRDATPLDPGLSDQEIVAVMRERLRRVHTTAQDALSQCMRCPAVATMPLGGPEDGGFLVDADIVEAFAAQLRLDGAAGEV
ncbi:unnamed protein product [Prorocentrum cordatum]|uniref:Uncharacterized protein n=1 Tax=Prorocentrum cordatum TaxID=2364126 RepID=A0ABN9R7A0_9DINO|nr:unnamed protein product [Polarella glacialis]